MALTFDTQKGLQDFTVQESTAPYIKAVVSDGSTAVDACRAVYIKVAGNYALTVNGTAVTFTGLLAGTIYPISCTLASSANVIHLY
ncbi:hypothetical protein CMI47_07025 [Candidatus Pacearchaeota archaeon]|nr:hypothetical protein [Candidatus Pacearchaeota archaeon]